jgi:hypothetical protein
MAEQTMFIRSESKGNRDMNDVLSGFLNANPLQIKNIDRVIEGKKYGWNITYESE